MKLFAAEGLMYDPGLIECAEFDWFSGRCLEDGPSFTSPTRLRRRQSWGCPHSVPAQPSAFFLRITENL